MANSTTSGSTANPSSSSNPSIDLPPALQEQLQGYQKALEEEFNKKELVGLEGEDFEQIVRDTFKEHTPMACATIVWLCGNGESEATRIKAAKLILDEAFKIAAGEADPLKKLLAELSNNDPADHVVPVDADTHAEAANKTSGK